jgi:hypothetical protein
MLPLYVIGKQIAGKPNLIIGEAEVSAQERHIYADDLWIRV